MLSVEVGRKVIVFAVLTSVSIWLIATNYLRVQDMAGVGLNEVSIRFDDASGLYPSALVTYRGVTVGKVKRVALGSGKGAEATVRLDSDFRIPANATAVAHSTSAIGENYIDLSAPSDEGPWLQDGSVIAASRTRDLEPSGALLTGLNSLASSVPEDATQTVLDETTKPFAGSASDFHQLITSANELTSEANANAREIDALLADLPGFAEAGTKAAPDIQSSMADLAPWTSAIDQSAPEINSVLTSTPGTAKTVQGLINDIRSDVPILLADLLGIGQILKVYLPGVEQVLVLYPAVMGAIQSAATNDGAPGTIKLGARLTVHDPPNCYSGFLPLNNQRDFNDETRRPSVPPDLYCKVPHSDPRAVRGARNTPCMNVPGKRAASVEECLGKPIGSVSDPLTGEARSAAFYDPRNGRSMAPDGQVFEIGGLESKEGKVQTWQDLVLK